MSGVGIIILKIEGEKVNTQLKFDALTQTQMALILANLKNIGNKIQERFAKNLHTNETEERRKP